MVEGIVQGVGFRPYVYRLAVRLRLGGFVTNDRQGATIEVEGPGVALDRFADALGADLPPLAAIHRLRTEEVPVTGEADFVIAGSIATVVGAGQALVAADVATCADCLAELADPGDRRYKYPFTNCTNCGPRYTITTAVPYDRARTTMAGFDLCSSCAAEYADPADRRFDAQPVACPACGPALSQPLTAAADLVRGGRVLALKGLGGYQLVCDATDPAAVRRLRARKRRPDKPFAVMVGDLGAARALCQLDPAEAALLSSRRAPIVLVVARPAGPVAGEVAPGSRWLGLMLPTTPLHHLLVAELRRPLVVTSGNLSDEPIAIDDDLARSALAGVADGFLAHDRPIAARADDSVTRVVEGAPLLLRRARGYAPEPLPLPVPAPRPLLGAGGQLKHTFCLAAGDRALLSPHIGDLSGLDAMVAFEQTLAHHRALFGIDPEVVAHDLHPDYRSTRWAVEQQGMEPMGVQHHHAHVAACLADNGHTGPVVGLALDGAGYGPDGTLWGAEVLVCDLARFERAGHAAAVPMPGGEAAVREPWRMAAAYHLAAFGPDAAPPTAALAGLGERWAQVTTLAASGLASPPTSGAGRLFDAVGSLLTGRRSATYEGQAAIEVEQLADPADTRCLPCPVRHTPDGLVLDTPVLFAALVEGRRAGRSPAELAARFHNGLAAALIEAARVVAAERGLGTVALSGGCFQNALLMARVRSGLQAAGLRVLVHRHVPPNDGGISLGQAAVAAAALRDG